MLLNECRIIAENDEWITHSNCVGNTNVIIFDYPYNRNVEFTDLTRAYSWYDIYYKINYIKEEKNDISNN